jgi:HlyD family secretion protein
MAADLKALELQISIQEKSIQELQSKLAEADIRATRKGVITWISDKTGSTVNPGTELVRMADLSSFKVEGTMSETYADRVKAGTEVIVRVNGNDLRGNVATVNPAVENGTITCMIILEDKANSQLRPHLKVEVFIVTSFKKKTIRIKNCAAFDGSVEQEIFVINAGKAIRRKVTVGENNVDFVEILNGLRPGEEIITTDMTQYKHLDSFTID